MLSVPVVVASTSIAAMPIMAVVIEFSRAIAFVDMAWFIGSKAVIRGLMIDNPIAVIGRMPVSVRVAVACAGIVTDGHLGLSGHRADEQAECQQG